MLVDTRVIAEAPVRFLVAGMGDALATWFEADSCRLGTAEPMRRGGHAGRLRPGAAVLRDDPGVRRAGRILRAESRHAGPGPRRGGQHAAQRAGLRERRAGGRPLDPQRPDAAARHPPYFHGEKVAIGVLAGLFLADRPSRVIREVYDFCESVGLPTTLADVGLAEASDDDLRPVAEAACAEEETIHHEPCPVSPGAVLAAIKTADLVGRKRAELSYP